MAKPVNQPQMVAAMTERTMPKTQWMPQLTQHMATSTVTMEMIEPTARLMPPAIMTNMTPMPATPIMEDWRRMVIKLLAVRNAGLPMVKMAASSTITMTTVYSLIKFNTFCFFICALLL